MWYLIAAIAVIVVLLIVRGLRRKREDKPPTSLVLLLSAPRSITEQEVREKVGSALDIIFEEGDDATTFVVAMPEELPMKAFGHPGQIFMVKTPQGLFHLLNINTPYMQDIESVAKRIKDMRLQRILRTHQAWLSFDLLGGAEGITDADAYRSIGKVIAAFSGDDCLGVYSPSLQRCNEIDESIAERLAGGDPLAIFGHSTNVPVIGVKDDDPRMQAAVAEARNRWQEFADAFAHPTPAQRGFSVKAKFTEGDNTEFMWIGVTAISEDSVAGELGNDPNELRHLKLGDPVTIPVAEIQDWLYVDGDQMVGGFSVKVLQEIGMH